jgi:hypothetical protein
MIAGGCFRQLGWTPSAEAISLQRILMKRGHLTSLADSLTGGNGPNFS